MSEQPKEQEKTKLPNIILSMKDKIKDAKKHGDDLDDASYNYELGILLSPNEAQIVLDALSRLAPSEKWISVNDDHPTSEDRYAILFILDGDPKKLFRKWTADWINGHWTYSAPPNFSEVRITHWMPLPPLPEGDKV